MSEHSDDPYECHARYYLRKLQQESGEFNTGVHEVDRPIRELGKAWPQILAAFSWASAARASSPAAAGICDALLVCAEGDIAQLQLRRRSGDVRKLADSVSLAARRQERPNDAAFLYRVAGIAVTQARILEIAEETGADVRALMGGLLTGIVENNRQDPK
jgi:hypothetical protein